MRRLLLAVLALLAPAIAFAQDAVPTGKLPDQVQPIAYRLDFTIVPEQPRFSGHTEIDFQLKAASSFVYLHGRNLTVTSATLRQGRGKAIPVTFKQISPTGLARLDFGRTLPAGKVTVKLDYSGAFGDGPSGLYRIKVGDEWYSWTQFESIDARAAFPGFDEPGFKTPFTVSITTKPGFVAASNAPEIGTKAAGKMVTHSFAPTKPLPTYLVALVTGPFATVQTTVPPTPERKTPLPLRVIATKPNAPKMQFALNESGKIVALLEHYFGQAFPFPKLDQIGSPVMPGAMENAGADIYGDGILFLDENDDVDSKQTFGMVVAHELSHQWFGDLVSPAWWDDIWLNESFANWMGYRIGNEWRPGLNIDVNAINEGFEAMELDALVAGRPVHQHITRDEDVDAAFDQITYGKGGQVVAMIAAYLGDEKFRDGVRLHMQRHEYGNASTDQFFGALADGAKDQRVLAALRSFVDQQGVPVVTLRHENGTLTGTQQRYAAFGTNAPAEQWIIPFCVRRAETRSCTLIDGASAPIEAKGDGILVPNAGGWGYYRFDMDADDWGKLIGTAATLPQGEALAVDDSLWASFHAGKASTAQVLALSRAMAAHPALKIFEDSSSRLRSLFRGGLISDAALSGYRKAMRDIYGPQLAKLGFDPALGVYAKENEEQRSRRATLASLVIGAGRDPELKTKLLAATDAYLAGDNKALDPQFMQLGFAIAAAERGVPFAKTLAEKALTIPPLRQIALRGLSGSNNAEVGRWFFEEFKDPRLSPRERLFLSVGFMSQPATQDVAANYLIGNFDTLAAGMGGSGIFSARAAGMFDVLCSNAQADAVSAKLRPALKNTLALDRAMEQVRDCARFKDAKAAEVSAAFAN